MVELGAKAGRVLESDFDASNKVWGIAYLPALIMVDLTQPLFPSFFLDRPNKPTL